MQNSYKTVETKTIANTGLPDSVQTVTYDRERLKTKIVHLGFGAFHRAHQALYTHDLAKISQSDWGICEVNLFTGKDPITLLKEQDFLYTVLEKKAVKGSSLPKNRDSHQDSVEKKQGEMTSIAAKTVGVVTDALHPALDSIDAIIEKMAEPQIAIVSLTITEKGYCCDLSTGLLDEKNDLIIYDLRNPQRPKSAIAYIVQALKRRYERGLNPFAVLSCDNIQSNGHVAKTAVLSFAQLVDGKLAKWIEKNVMFPCSMVDRIVPAVTADTQQEIASVLGVPDYLGIACEPFRQWVIEDNFIHIAGKKARPEWNLAGAEFVDNVAPFEEMKLRMLNGSHSFLAYLGYLGGYHYIAQTIDNDDYRQSVLALMMQEQAPTLTVPQGTDLQAYANSLIDRFSNTALKHMTHQIAMDGSQKLPQRFIQAINFHIKHGSDYRYLAMGVAGWMRYVSGIDEQGNPIKVQDPMLKQLQTIHQNSKNHLELVKSLLSIDAIFGKELIHNTSFITHLLNAYQLLIEKGARGALASLNHRSNKEQFLTNKEASSEGVIS